MPRRHPVTAAVRAGICSDHEHGAVVPPIHLSSTFTFEGFGIKRQYDYTRSGNPTRDQLGAAIAELEGASGGVITSSGMSAITTVLQLVRPGDLILATHDCYGGTHRLLTHLSRRGLFDVEFRDLGKWVEDGNVGTSERRPRLVWIETPSNPLLRITDIAAVADKAHALGALVVADNTFLSPAWQRPLDYGADIVVHSTTKYLNGHSDVVGGAVVARDASLVEELGWWANCLGVTGAPFDSYLTLRGIRTLHARARIHEENAVEVVAALGAHPAVERVWYPGLRSHPGHEIAVRQQLGFGAMVSFELRGGERAVRQFLDGLNCFTLAESLGGVESLVAHPATMTHAAMDAEARAFAGIRDTVLRLSVGIESAEDLVADIEAGLGRVDCLGATVLGATVTSPGATNEPLPSICNPAF
ncbi:MAG: cystathionine gamma-synthase [Gemmatimonadota bacterium]